MTIKYEYTCECEHAAHTEGGNTPHGNPGHKYGARFYTIIEIRTAYGLFRVCDDCEADCHAQLRSQDGGR